MHITDCNLSIKSIKQNLILSEDEYIKKKSKHNKITDYGTS